jgi:hypothetical protein
MDDAAPTMPHPFGGKTFLEALSTLLNDWGVPFGFTKGRPRPSNSEVEPSSKIFTSTSYHLWWLLKVFLYKSNVIQIYTETKKLSKIKPKH